MLLQTYGFQATPYEDIKIRSERAGFSTLPFFPPDTVRATPQLSARLKDMSGLSPAQYIESISRLAGAKPIIKYYIRTGLRASQLICRNHLTRLDEGNQYLEFLKKEFGVASTFASGIMALVNANGTLTKSLLIATTGINEGFNAYGDYQFLSINRDSARLVVETAQNKYAEYFLNQVDASTIDNNVAVGGYTFSDAIHAVSEIEYQCTREGIRFLLNRSINNTPPNMEIDAGTGTIMFKSAQVDVDKGTGTQAIAIVTAPKNVQGKK